MQLHAAAPMFALIAAGFLDGCAYDPHPASGSTPGDPDHPGSASISNDQQATRVPPGASGTRATPLPLGAHDPTGGPPSTLNGYGDPTSVEQGR